MNTDILELLLNIKENIRLVEDNKHSQATLEEIKEDFLQMMELLKLFLISERDLYYGYFLMNMKFSVSLGSDSVAGIKLNTFPAVFEANPLLLCKFGIKEIIYITCHEIDHVVMNHPTEMVKANPTFDKDIGYRFNLAADASVNDAINHEIVAEKHNFMSAPQGIITSKVLEQMFRLKYVKERENYAYYFRLIQDTSQKQQSGSQSMQSNDQNDGEQGSEETSKDENNSNSSPNNGKNVSNQTSGNTEEVFTANDAKSKGISDHNWEAGSNPEEAESAVKELMNASYEMMNEETRGLMPGGFIAQIARINEPPKITWQQVLKKYVGTIPTNKRKTRMRLNRRQPERFDLSGTMDDKILKITVAIDTSGSVDDRMIAQIFNEIFDILAKRKHDITIIECDAKVERVYKVKKRDEVKKVIGRGGTLFTPVIEYINTHKEFRDTLLIYFTDGYGENSIPKPLTYRNIWAVFGGAKNLSLKEPYGIVLSID